MDPHGVCLLETRGWGNGHKRALSTIFNTLIVERKLSITSFSRGHESLGMVLFFDDVKFMTHATYFGVSLSQITIVVSCIFM